MQEATSKQEAELQTQIIGQCFHIRHMRILDGSCCQAKMANAEATKQKADQEIQCMSKECKIGSWIVRVAGMLNQTCRRLSPMRKGRPRPSRCFSNGG